MSAQHGAVAGRACRTAKLGSRGMTTRRVSNRMRHVGMSTERDLFTVTKPYNPKVTSSLGERWHQSPES